MISSLSRFLKKAVISKNQSDPKNPNGKDLSLSFAFLINAIRKKLSTEHYEEKVIKFKKETIAVGSISHDIYNN